MHVRMGRRGNFQYEMCKDTLSANTIELEGEFLLNFYGKASKGAQMNGIGKRITRMSTSVNSDQKTLNLGRYYDDCSE